MVSILLFAVGCMFYVYACTSVAASSNEGAFAVGPGGIISAAIHLVTTTCYGVAQYRHGDTLQGLGQQHSKTNMCATAGAARREANQRQNMNSLSHKGGPGKGGRIMRQSTFRVKPVVCHFQIVRNCCDLGCPFSNPPCGGGDRQINNFFITSRKSPSPTSPPHRITSHHITLRRAPW